MTFIWAGLLAVEVGMGMLLVELWQRRTAGRCWQERWSRCGRVHGEVVTRGGVTPSLFLGDGLHRLSFSPGMDRGYISWSLLFWLPYGII